MKTATPATVSRPTVTSTVGALSDRALLRQTSALVRHERHLQGAIIDHLAEIDARCLYLQRGFSSLFDYAVRGLGYSDAAASRRIGAVRLCADQPGARERLRDGSLTLSAAAELQWAFDRQRRRGSVSGAAPAGSAPPGAPMAGDSEADPEPAVLSSPADPRPPLVLDAVGRHKLVQEAAGKSARQVRRMLADLDPELAVPPDRVRPLGDGRYELKAVIDADCQQGLEHLRGLLSHLDPRMTVGQLVGRLVQEGLTRHDPSRPPRRERTGSRLAGDTSEPAPAARDQTAPDCGDASTAQDAATPAGPTPTPERALQPPAISAPSSNRNGPGRPAAAGRKPTGAGTPTSASRRSGRAIPAAVKRHVWQRDGGRCSYVDRQTGRRCDSRHLIEMDHILPYAMGGGAGPENLRLLCSAHHRQRHAPPGSRHLPEH